MNPMKSKILTLPLVFLLLNVPAGIAEDTTSSRMNDRCELPPKPTIPDGSSVTEDELIAVQAVIKTYMVHGNNYLECIKKVEEGWGETATPEQQALVITLHNGVVDDMEMVASFFNLAVRSYKEKNQ